MWQKDDTALGAEYQYVVNSIQQMEPPSANRYVISCFTCSAVAIAFGLAVDIVVTLTEQTCFHSWVPTPGGGVEWDASPRSKILWGRPPRNRDFYRYLFEQLTKIFRFFKIFKIKWPKSKEKSEFGGRWA